MKKRKACLLMGLMVMTLSFAGCGKTEQAPVQEVEFSSIAEVVTPAETESEVPTETQTEEESREGMYRSEITNEWIDEGLKNQRPIAVMVDNEKTALPHYGVSQADVVYEMMNSTANGRITRLMCIVKDWGSIEQFGSIRSTRPTNILLAAEWNAVLCHDGGPFYIDNYLKNDYAAHFSGTFSRVNNGKPREYTEYICKGDLDKNFSNSKYGTEYNQYYEGEHFVFADSEVNLDGKKGVIDAKEIKLPFSHNGSTLKYNEETGTYDYYEYGSVHQDPGNDNATLTFKNVLIQNCSFHQYDENGYMIYNCIGTDDAYYVTNGKAYPVKWLKAGDTMPTVFTDLETGEPIEINTGKTYITLIPSDSWEDVVIK